MKTGSVALVAGVIGCAFVQPVPAAEAAKFSEKVVWFFARAKDGVIPAAGLINANGTLYGTTTYGGHHHGQGGTVFSLNLGTGEEKVLYSFCSQQNCVDGEWPTACRSD